MVSVKPLFINSFYLKEDTEIGKNILSDMLSSV